MILGLGTDIVNVERFLDWTDSPEKINRFFNQKELFVYNGKNKQRFAEHYAARWAAKEAFAKALGTGFIGFEITDSYVINEESGKPLLIVEKNAEKIMREKFGNCKIHVSLSHEKQFAIATVIIESE